MTAKPLSEQEERELRSEPAPADYAFEGRGEPSGAYWQRIWATLDAARARIAEQEQSLREAGGRIAELRLERDALAREVRACRRAHAYPDNRIDVAALEHRAIRAANEAAGLPREGS